MHLYYLPKGVIGAGKGEWRGHKLTGRRTAVAEGAFQGGQGRPSGGLCADVVGGLAGLEVNAELLGLGGGGEGGSGAADAPRFRARYGTQAGQLVQCVALSSGEAAGGAGAQEGGRGGGEGLLTGEHGMVQASLSLLLAPRPRAAHRPAQRSNPYVMVAVPLKVFERPNPGSRLLDTDRLTAGPMPAYLGPLMAYPQDVWVGTQPACGEGWWGRWVWDGVGWGSAHRQHSGVGESAVGPLTPGTPLPPHVCDAVLLVARGARVVALQNGRVGWGRPALRLVNKPRWLAWQWAEPRTRAKRQAGVPSTMPPTMLPSTHRAPLHRLCGVAAVNVEDVLGAVGGAAGGGGLDAHDCDEG